MLTRCPHCSTTFRVQPEQLKARHGRVRCGHCQQVFDALETLIDLPGPAVAPVASAQSAVASEAVAPAVVVTDMPASPGRAQESPATLESAPQATASESASNVAPDAQDPIPPEPALATDPAPSAGDGAQAGEAVNEADWAAVVSGRAPVLHQPDQPAARPLWRAVVLAAAIGFALAALLLQATYAWRSTLALTWPESRPLLEAACQHLGCTLDLPRQPDLLSIESSDLHPEPGAPERLILAATLRNRADHVQAWPHLELSLTDSADRAVVRRVFAPAEYVPYLRAGTLADGLGANTEVQLEMRFEIGKLAASGYRLYVFYP